MLTILSTGVGGASGMYTLKILRETTDFRLIACDASPYSSGILFGDSFHKIPFAKYKDQFMDCLESVVVKEGVDYIIPNVDEELALFAELNRIKNAKVIISPLESVKNSLDKYKTYQILHEYVPCPKTFLLRDFSYQAGEWIIKPRFGRGSKDIYRISSKETFDSLVSYLLSNGHDNESLIIQEMLPGKEYTVDVICNNSGEALVLIPRERLLTSGGISAIGKTVKNHTLQEQAKEVLKRIPFLGPINIQFKDDHTGNLKLMEINPRCSGGMSISFKSGLNIPLLAIKMVENEQISEQELQWEETLVFRYYEDRKFNVENNFQS